jgi:hypothetical protein
MNITRAVLDTSLTDGRWLALPDSRQSAYPLLDTLMQYDVFPGDTLLRVERCQTCVARSLRYKTTCVRCSAYGFLRAGLLTVKAVVPVVAEKLWGQAPSSCVAQDADGSWWWLIDGDNDCHYIARMPDTCVPGSVVLDLAPAECENGCERGLIDNGGECNCGYGGFHEPLNPRCDRNSPCPVCTGPVSVEWTEGNPIGTVR